MFVGGCKVNKNGIPRNNPWNKIHHVIFNSEFGKRITISRYKKIKKNSVVYLLGGAISDPNRMNPLTTGRVLDENINFVICAKWWKRKFKRLKQSIELFNKYILPKYPNSTLNILGHKGDPKTIGNIVYHQKSFHNSTVYDVYNKSHIQILLTPFDRGPLTLSESLHYRIPFICSHNCCGPEFIKLVDGKCGEAVKIDTILKSASMCRKIQPMTNKKHYNKNLDYKLIMSKVDKIIDNYDYYTEWKWNDNFNYKSQAKKWLEAIVGCKIN